MEVAGDLEPLGVLGGHGVHDADKGLIAVEEAVASGEQIALQPALAHMLGQHAVHDAAFHVQVLVTFHHFGVPAALGSFKGPIQAVGFGLVGTEHAEVFGVGVEAEHVTDVAAQLGHVLGLHTAGNGDVHGVLAEVGQPQVPQQLAAVGMGVGAHAAVALGGHLPQQLAGSAVLVKQLFKVIGAQPVLHLPQMLGLAHIHRHLMGAEGALDDLAVGLLDAGPALGGPQNDHGPAGALGLTLLPCLLLRGTNVPDALVQRVGHILVGLHVVRAVGLHEIRLPAASLKELLQLVLGDPGQQSGVSDLITVQVQDGQHGAVHFGAEELVGVPGGGQGAGLGLTVAHHAGGDQVGIVKHRAEGVGQAVTQLAALVDGAWDLGRHMAGDAAGEGELLEQFFHALLVLADVGIDLAVRAVQPVLGHHGVAAVTGAGQIDHVEVVLVDDAVQMGIDEVLAGNGAPVANDLLFDVFGPEGLLQQGVVQQVKLTGGQEIGSAPPGVQLLQHGFGYHKCFLLLFQKSV